MAGDKEPLKAWRDLAQGSLGVPPGGSALESPFLQGLLAGYVVAKLRGGGVVAALLGTVTGMYVAQTYQVPNIESTVKDCLDKLRKELGPK